MHFKQMQKIAVKLEVWHMKNETSSVQEAQRDEERIAELLTQEVRTTAKPNIKIRKVVQ